jgi:hypothetical protein
MKYPDIDAMCAAHIDDMMETTDGSQDSVVAAAMATLMLAGWQMAEGDVENAIELLTKHYRNVVKMMDGPGFGKEYVRH